MRLWVACKTADEGEYAEVAGASMIGGKGWGRVCGHSDFCADMSHIIGKHMRRQSLMHASSGSCYLPSGLCQHQICLPCSLHAALTVLGRQLRLVLWEGVPVLAIAVRGQVCCPQMPWKREAPQARLAEGDQTGLVC